MRQDQHPTVLRHRERMANQPASVPAPMTQAQLRDLALAAGADDAAAVNLDAPELDECRDELRQIFPRVRSLVCIIQRLNPDNVRCVDRAVADSEFLHGFKSCEASASQLAIALREHGIRAVQHAVGFPMNLENWPEKMWSVSHKTVAEAAGLGRMGHNRLLLHPLFGAFVVIDTLLIDAPVEDPPPTLDFAPCLECKLCASVCPVGAIAPDGHFSFATCMVHNYRDRLGGFSDWVENVVAASDVSDYRKRVSDPETVSMWQSLSYGICNKSSYCMAVCPAGDDVIGPWLEDRKRFIAETVAPLKAREERVFVLPHSDGEAYVQKRFPHKKSVRVGSGLRPQTAAGFLTAMPLVFNRNVAGDLDATFHFTFTGAESLDATIVIRDRTVEVATGLQGKPDLKVTTDTNAWLKMLAKETGPVKLLLTRKLKVSGPTSLLKKFAACFPG